MTDDTKRFSSEFFEIQTLADGVYAAVGPQAGLCHSNAGIVDLGDRTLVFDTLTLPSYGKDLARACRELTGRDPTWISLSHFHSDHWLGNQAFAEGTPILTTHDMLPPLEEWMTEYGKLPDELDDFAKRIDELAETCAKEPDAKKREGIETNLARYRALHKEAPELRVVAPNMAFSGTLRLMGSKRSVELIEVKKAHTVSDVYLSIADAQVVFMGDLGFFDTIPFLMYADPMGWIEALKALETVDAKTFVPGHGVVGEVDRVRRTRECIEAIVDVVRDAQEADEALEGALLERLPKPFRSWAEGRTWMKEQLEAVAKAIGAGSSPSPQSES
jgi:glyoxylase-like metal-dependent hydrolase (beta-lactamase superfamily II)